MCRGTGKINGTEQCDICLGTGKIKKYKIIELGNKLVNSELLLKLYDLPNCKIAPDAVEYLKPIPFKFDNGIGIIMPCRKE